MSNLVLSAETMLSEYHMHLAELLPCAVPCPSECAKAHSKLLVSRFPILHPVAVHIAHLHHITSTPSRLTGPIFAILPYTNPISLSRLARRASLICL
jgi:hypothetical protein